MSNMKAIDDQKCICKDGGAMGGYDSEYLAFCDFCSGLLLEDGKPIKGTFADIIEECEGPMHDGEDFFGF